jgi:hypothetical protein
MSSPPIDEHLAAAIDLWEPLAAFAWERFITEGRGVVLIDRDGLHQLAAAHRKQRDEDHETLPASLPSSVTGSAHAPLGYVCVRDVPPSDDFAPIIAEYDPQRQIVLLIQLEGGDERLYLLEASDRRHRPTPRECFEAAGTG